MKKFGQILGFIILLVSVLLGGGIITGALPANAFVWDVFRVFCDDGQTINKTGTTIQCMDAEGEIESNIVGEVVTSTIIVALIAGIIGFVLILRYSPPRNPQVLSDKFDQFAKDRNLQRVHTYITADEKQAFKNVATGQTDLASRLKQLQDAYEQNLITSEEYEKTRQSLLDGFDD